MIPYLHRYFAKDLIKNEKVPVTGLWDSYGDSRGSIQITY